MTQSEIWLIDLNPTVGSEIKKTRPCVIVSDNLLGKLPLKIIVPITDWKLHYQVAPWMVEIKPDMDNNLTKNSSAGCFQIRSVAKERFVKRIGVINTAQLALIKRAMAAVLSIS